MTAQQHKRKSQASMEGIRGLAQQRLEEKRQRSVLHFAGATFPIAAPSGATACGGATSRSSPSKVAAEDAENGETAAKGGKAGNKGAGTGMAKADSKSKEKGDAK